MSRSAAIASETERKYEIDDRAVLPDAAGVDASAERDRHRLEAVYFDTADLNLLRAGVTLRRREGGQDEGWHLKLPIGADTREEVRLPLNRGGMTQPPAELVSLTRLHTRGAALSPVARLVTDRRRWTVTDADGAELAEVAEDRVEAHTMGSSTTATSWREVEVELAEQGSTKVLHRIERSLLSAGARRAESGSKLGRVLAEHLPEDAGSRKATKRRRGPRAPRPGTAGAAVLDYVRAQVEEIRGYDPLVRRDAPDAVHRMRVASRRLRSALQAYRRILDRSATDGLVDELRWLGNELSEARDSEVIAERLHTMIDALPDELVLGPVAAQTARTLQRRHSDGRERALAALDSDRYLALHDALDRLLTDPPLTAKAGRKAKRELPKSVAKAWRRTAKRMAAADRATGERRDTGLHETRKAAKRLRYAVEVAEPALGKKAKRLRKRLKAVHSLLGDHQDAVVARPTIRELAVQGHLEGGNGFTHGVLFGLEANRAEEVERKLPDTWDRLRRDKALRGMTKS